MTSTPWDILNAGLIGFALGGPLSALSKGENAALKQAASTGAHETTLRGMQAIDPDIKLLPSAQKLLALPAPKPDQLDAEFLRGVKADFSKQVDNTLAEMFPPVPKDPSPLGKGPLGLSEGPDPDPIRFGEGSLRPDRSRFVGSPDVTPKTVFDKITADNPRPPSELEIGAIRAKLNQLSVRLSAKPSGAPETLADMVDAKPAGGLASNPDGSGRGSSGNGTIEPTPNAAAGEPTRAVSSAAESVPHPEVIREPDQSQPRLSGQFNIGDTVYYRDGRASGKVLKVLPNGKVSIRDDMTDAPKVVRPDDADPFLSPGLLDDSPGSGLERSSDDSDEFVICVR